MSGRAGRHSEHWNGVLYPKYTLHARMELLVVKSYNVDFCPPLAAAPRVTALLQTLGQYRTGTRRLCVS